MKSWAVCSLQACISTRAVTSQVRERMQLRASLLNFQLDEGADVAARVPAAAPGRMRPSGNADESHALQNHFSWIQEPVKVLDFFFPRCESEAQDHLAHLRFARLGLVEQQ